MTVNHSDQVTDFVITWVDGNDPEWQKRKARYTGTDLDDDRIIRYRDWGLLPYWFRGVEKFAPWVRKVFFVCDQEPPEWLNRDHPKLQIVRHEDFIPGEYLPVFSANPIELNLYRIKDLSDHFVFFNDDMYLVKPVSEKLFFKKGLPRDCAILNPIPTSDLKRENGSGKIFTIPLNDTEYLNRDYDFRACVRKNPGKWFHPVYGASLFRNLFLSTWSRFVGFYEPHLPQPFLKSSFDKAWREDYDILDSTSRHAIRNDRDVNQWLIRQRQLAEGVFIPRKQIKNSVFELDSQSTDAVRTIAGQLVPMVCLNDGVMGESEFTQIRDRIEQAFRTILPDRSGFEKEPETDKGMTDAAAE